MQGTAATYSDPRAHQLRARYDQIFGGGGPPVPVEAIADDLLGLDVTETQLNGISGVMIPVERRIYLNASDTPARRRFTLAHEVGHWVCQCLEGRGQPLMCRVEDLAAVADRAVEREANVFAAELLMPEEAVRASWPDDVNELALRFGVSTQAMHWRLYSFGLVSEAPR